jgi:hypothetical protein
MERTMAFPRRRLISIAAVVLVLAVGGWTYYQRLVPAVHEDHDHGLQNIAGGGFLRVERAEGGTRNLVGRPGRVLILHWFELGNAASMNELPALVDYMNSIAEDQGIEVVMVAGGRKRKEVFEWARDHGVPTANLYVDSDRETTRLIGVRGMPETLIYDPEGRLAHQSRGPVNWADPQIRARIEHFKHGAGEHTH